LELLVTDEVIRVKIKRLPHGVGVELPTFQTSHAAAADLHAAVDDDTTIAPGEVALIPCGFAMAVPEGYEAQVRPRSGLAAKHAVSLPNSPGTIDADYRGEVKVILINHNAAPFVVTRNMRIAQMLIKPVLRFAWDEVDELDDTHRGAGGFGSTGH